MSLRPQRLLRSRFSAGLPSWVPQPGWYRPRTKIQAARYASNEASKSNSTPSGDIETIVDNINPLSSPANAHSRDFRVVSASTLDSRPDHSSGNVLIDPRSSGIQDDGDIISDQAPGARGTGKRPLGPSRQFGRFKGLLSIEGQKSTFGPGPSPRIVYNTKTSVNGELRNRQRVVDRMSMTLEKQIRDQTFFYSGAEVHKWRLACSDLYKSRFYERDPENELIRNLNLSLRELDLLEKIKADCQGSFREAWEALSKEQKAVSWHHLSLWLLQNSPELTLDFLLVTSQSKVKPIFIMVADCFLFLDAFHYDSLKHWEKGTHTYQSVLQTALSPYNWPILFVPQKGVRLFLQRADSDGVNLAFKLVRERKIHMKSETYLCFMRRFAELGDVNQALVALENVRRLKQNGLLLSSEGVMRHCCKLLTLDSVQDGPDGRNFHILPKLLEMGVRPDRDMMNIVLSNAFKTGDQQLGLDMLDFMRNQGLEPDSFTYLTLLGDAVARGDRDRVHALMREIEPHEDLQKNPWIASKIFHAHFVFTAKKIDSDADPNGVFYSMLDMYNRLHDITPLKELSIIPPEYTPPAGGDKSPPSLVALYIMIATYLRCRKHISAVQRVYTKFRSHVLQGHPSIAPLAASDHTYNEFLVAFRDDPHGMRPAVRLVEDMLHSYTKYDVGQRKHDSEIIHAKPTVRTWTLLLSCFIFNRQPLAAERVKEMMARHNIEYNMATWNTIIGGYANQQNIPEVAKAIKAMEAEGFTIDAYTMKCLRYLRDPERLWVAIEELDKASEPVLDNVISSSDPSHLTDELKESEQLLDQGLERLKTKAGPKL